MSRWRTGTSCDLENELQVILRRYKAYARTDESELIRRAFAFTANAHEGQERMTGEPYVIHPHGGRPAS